VVALPSVRFAAADDAWQARLAASPSPDLPAWWEVEAVLAAGPARRAAVHVAGAGPRPLRQAALAVQANLRRLGYDTRVDVARPEPLAAARAEPALRLLLQVPPQEDGAKAVGELHRALAPLLRPATQAPPRPCPPPPAPPEATAAAPVSEEAEAWAAPAPGEAPPPGAPGLSDGAPPAQPAAELVPVRLPSPPARPVVGPPTSVVVRDAEGREMAPNPPAPAHPPQAAAPRPPWGAPAPAAAGVRPFPRPRPRPSPQAVPFRPPGGTATAFPRPAPGPPSRPRLPAPPSAPRRARG
jgi:hypothetical protein